eukprot:scaffold95452_cov40-Prasinocladus_malaysianus.AAC.4
MNSRSHEERRTRQHDDVVTRYNRRMGSGRAALLPYGILGLPDDTAASGNERNHLLRQVKAQLGPT